MWGAFGLTPEASPDHAPYRKMSSPADCLGSELLVTRGLSYRAFHIECTSSAKTQSSVKSLRHCTDITSSQ